MALIQCSECGNEISDKAEACPYCGNPDVKVQVKEDVLQQKKRKKVNNKFIIAGSIVIIAIISILSLVLLKQNHRTPLEKKVSKCYQVLKKEKGKNITLKDAMCFKRTNDDGNVSYRTLLVYTSHGLTEYAGFDSDGEYIGNGDENVSSTDLEIEVVWNNCTVTTLIIEYEQYAKGGTELYYSEKYDEVLSEEEAADKERGAIPISIKNVK
ncbi:MAG: hydrogenase maturation nickel metallochaperone HypA [Lachnospiraceae bacterium]|nr:hydrogenase maturation nickel metallochaperone HypA [Lachnospiraceae bacterium]